MPSRRPSSCTPRCRAGSSERSSAPRSSSSPSGLRSGTRDSTGSTSRATASQIRTLAEITLTLVLFADASRIDLRTAWREHAVPARLLGIGLPLTIFAGWLVGVLAVRRSGRGGGPDPCGHPRSDRRCARPGGRHRRAPAFQDPPGPERRERPERRALRPDPAGRDRDRRHRRREDHRSPRRRGWLSRRSAAARSAASSRVRSRR